MLDNEPRTVDEAYGVASNTSDLSVDADKRQSADVILAAGMSDSRLGMALLRLVSEWDAAAKPRRLTEPQISRLADTYRDDKGRPNEHRARTEAVLWYARELRLLAQGLRSRGVVLAQVRAWALGKGMDADLVGPAIFHWLSPTCPVCDGRGMRKIPDAPALSAKRCHACDAGKVRRPEGSTRIQNHLDHAVSVARTSLKKRLRG